MIGSRGISPPVSKFLSISEYTTNIKMFRAFVNNLFHNFKDLGHINKVAQRNLADFHFQHSRKLCKHIDLISERNSAH